MKKTEEKDIARKRILKLFCEGKKVFNSDSKLSNRYIELARKLSMKFKVRIPNHLKRRFCKYCNYYLVPDKNCRIRLHKTRVIYYCLNCKRFMRIHYKQNR
ncbi:MAG: ribonuclease P [Nanoarchaeota archaeon]